MSEIITCPSGLSGRIRGMKVREERILADRKLAKNGGQVDELLGGQARPGLPQAHQPADHGTGPAAIHQNNTEGLRAQVRRTITAFLLTQMNNGAFRNREPSKAFFVDVSETLNTPSVIFAGKLIARVGLATNKPAEFIVLRISQDTRALEAELAAAGA